MICLVLGVLDLGAYLALEFHSAWAYDETMSESGTLQKVITALRELGGRFVFADDDGTEYLVMRKTDFERLEQAASDVQLDLLSINPSAPAPSADDMLGKINRDIALWQITQQDEESDSAIDDLAATDTPTRASRPTPPPVPRRVKFEAIKGDLPPDLQE